MIDLPDTRSYSTETLTLLRKLVVRAVVDQGFSHREAARLFGVREHTVGDWCALYREQGLPGLTVQETGRPMGSGRSLTPHQEEQAQNILRQEQPSDHDIPLPTWTRQAVATLLEQLFEVKLTLQAVGKYLARWEITPQKPASHAREQDPEEVQEFVEETLPETLERADDEEAQLHFTDETGAQVGDQIGTSYAPQGETPVIDMPKTRIEQNVISSVTPEGDLFFWAFSGNLNADKFLHFLQHLVSETSQKIFVFADHHPAHKAKPVEQWLEAHRSEIEIVWLPRYSPEYNPDEFLNNDLKQNLTEQELPEDTSMFRQTICDILEAIKSMPERIQGYFRQAKIDLATES